MNWQSRPRLLALCITPLLGGCADFMTRPADKPAAAAPRSYTAISLK